MMLWQVARDMTRRLPQWDASAKLSLALAVPLLLLMLGLGFFGPDALQFPARIGAFGLLVTLQLLFLWGNRREASPYHQAQRHFIAGDYQGARALLEALPDRGRESADALVLLGNAYRNLGMFEPAQAALAKALATKPRHELALFSVGKLRLARGEYAAACEYLEGAMAAGAPDIVNFELGQAHYLLGNRDRASQHFEAARSALADDPASTLLLNYYIKVLNTGEWPADEYRRDGIQFWRGEAAKYADTPFGAHLAEAVANLDAALENT